MPPPQNVVGVPSAIREEASAFAWTPQLSAQPVFFSRPSDTLAVDLFDDPGTRLVLLLQLGSRFGKCIDGSHIDVASMRLGETARPDTRSVDEKQHAYIQKCVKDTSFYHSGTFTTPRCSSLRKTTRERKTGRFCSTPAGLQGTRSICSRALVVRELCGASQSRDQDKMWLSGSLLPPSRSLFPFETIEQ